MKVDKKRITEIIISFILGFVICYLGFVIIPLNNNSFFEQGTYTVTISNIETKKIIYDSGNVSLDWLINNSIVEDDSINNNIVKDFCINHNIELGEYKQVYVHEKNCYRFFPPCDYWTTEFVPYRLDMNINYFKNNDWINIKTINL